MKVLYVTTVSSTLNIFFKAHIEMLVKEGHRVDLACNDTGWTIDESYKELGCRYYHIDFSRSPMSKDNIKAYGQLKRIIEDGNYDIVHCHTPNASVITRVVCRKFRKRSGLKVFYTAHGFHFYKGASKRNWMLYYPIEKVCSYFTDKLITINTEDYELAKKRFKAKEIHYIPGVGVDFSRFKNVQVDRSAKRRELCVPEDAFLLISVGELNENKNHQIIIKALAKLNDPKIYYVIAGVGDRKEYLLELAARLGVSKQIRLLGFRKDIPELNYAADVFCFPSFREGLGVAAIEAMFCGIPLLTSNVHGINDYSTDELTGYKFAPTDVDGFRRGIEKLKNEEAMRLSIGRYNMNLANRYGFEEIEPLIRNLYGI